MEALNTMDHDYRPFRYNIESSLYRALSKDLQSRLPDLPRGIQLSLREMFSADLWDSLNVDQRRAVATKIHFMDMYNTYLMPTGRGLETLYSIHDRASPTAQLAKSAVLDWLSDDEVFHKTRHQLMGFLLGASEYLPSEFSDALCGVVQLLGAPGEHLDGQAIKAA
jgi:hypothetical protein